MQTRGHGRAAGGRRLAIAGPRESPTSRRQAHSHTSARENGTATRGMAPSCSPLSPHRRPSAPGTGTPPPRRWPAPHCLLDPHKSCSRQSRGSATCTATSIGCTSWTQFRCRPASAACSQTAIAPTSLSIACTFRGDFGYVGATRVESGPLSANEQVHLVLLERGASQHEQLSQPRGNGLAVGGDASDASLSSELGASSLKSSSSAREEDEERGARPPQMPQRNRHSQYSFVSHVQAGGPWTTSRRLGENIQRPSNGRQTAAHRVRVGQHLPTSLHTATCATPDSTSFASASVCGGAWLGTTLLSRI